MMSHRGPLTAVITVLGATLGGLIIWRVYRTKRKRLLSNQKTADPVEALRPVERELAPVEYQYTQPPLDLEKDIEGLECGTSQVTPPVRIPSFEEQLAVKPVMVSSEEEWQQLWPLMQRDLSVVPVLGLDCEWVKTKGVRNNFCMF